MRIVLFYQIFCYGTHLIHQMHYLLGSYQFCKLYIHLLQGSVHQFKISIQFQLQLKHLHIS